MPNRYDYLSRAFQNTMQQLQQQKQQNLNELMAIYQDVVNERRYQEGKSMEKEKFGLEQKRFGLSEKAEQRAQAQQDWTMARAESADTAAAEAAKMKAVADAKGSYLEYIDEDWPEETARELSGYAGPSVSVEEREAIRQRREQEKNEAAIAKELAIYGGKKDVDIAAVAPMAQAETSAEITSQQMLEQAGQAFPKDVDERLKVGTMLINKNMPLPPEIIETFGGSLGIDLSGYNEMTDAQRKEKSDEVQATIDLKKAQAKLAQINTRKATEAARAGGTQPQGAPRPLTPNEKRAIYNDWNRKVSDIDKTILAEKKRLSEDYRSGVDEQGREYYYKRDWRTKKESPRIYLDDIKNKLIKDAWVDLPDWYKQELSGMGYDRQEAPAQSAPGAGWVKQ